MVRNRPGRGWFPESWWRSSFNKGSGIVALRLICNCGPERARRICVSFWISSSVIGWPSLYVPLLPKLINFHRFPIRRNSRWWRETTELRSTIWLSAQRPILIIGWSVKCHCWIGTLWDGDRSDTVTTFGARFMPDKDLWINWCTPKNQTLIVSLLGLLFLEAHTLLRRVSVWSCPFNHDTPQTNRIVRFTSRTWLGG